MDTKYDIITIGVAIMDSMIMGFDPVPISTAGYRAESGSLFVGGDAVNQAKAAAKLGARTGILCHLGRDSAGDVIADSLMDDGVDTDLIVRSDDHQTPVTTIFVQEDGNRKSITNSAHRYNFHPERFTEVLTNTRAVMLGSLFRAPFNDPEVIYKVVRAAKQAGALVFADTKMPNYVFLSLSDIADSLPMIDYITPNLAEAEFYTGKKTPAEIANVFLDKGVKNVIVKLGEQGCYFANQETRLTVPTFNVATVDATGAGDNFTAGFVTEILRGSSPEEALRFANACGAICTTAIGSGTALKGREQILEFLGKN